MDNAKKTTKSNYEQLEVAANPSRVIPKLATKVAIGKANGNIILSFIFDIPGEQPQLIERVILDEQLASKLGGLINDAKEAK